MPISKIGGGEGSYLGGMTSGFKGGNEVQANHGNSFGKGTHHVETHNIITSRDGHLATGQQLPGSRPQKNSNSRVQNSNINQQKSPKKITLTEI